MGLVIITDLNPPRPPSQESNTCSTPSPHTPRPLTVTNTFWAPSFQAATKGWLKAGSGRPSASSGTTSWTQPDRPGRADPSLHRCGPRALVAHTLRSGHLLPEDTGESVGGGTAAVPPASSGSPSPTPPPPSPPRRRASPSSRRGASAAPGECASPAGPRRPLPQGPPRGIPPPPHSGSQPRDPYKPTSLRAAPRAPGGGWEGAGAGITKRRARPGGEFLVKPSLSRTAEKGALPYSQS